ncbi:MAG TPA: adenylate/guanylate cyclase domain-containing protein [Abditibacteriaceae bacterium]|jgi:adenylate cyclase
MKITYVYQDREECFQVTQKQVILGRPRPGGTVVPDLDLSPDRTVSRPHARLWADDESRYWIEDLGSTHGTQVDGREIKGQGACRVSSGSRICVGETQLLLRDVPFCEDDLPEFPSLPAMPEAAPPGEIARVLDANVSTHVLIEAATGRAGEADEGTCRLAMLYELLAKVGAVTQADVVPQIIVEWLLEAIPQAAHGSLLLRNGENDALLLKAYRSPDGPVVSETLARRAMQEKIGFIWQRSDETEVGASIAQHRLEAGMYAPLLWRGVALGAICVSSSVERAHGQAAFSEDDLRLLLMVAHYAAMSLSNQMLQEELRRESAIKANLLRQFSPSVAEQFLSRGSLQLSGERSEVTILYSDIRGFTNLSRNMEPIEVVEMLNDYFNRLIPIIFAHGGTVDKYIGDAILAVFGSPKPDAQQHENAVRAAMDMQDGMRKLNERRAAQGKTTCEIGIGVDAGEVLHGFIGVLDRMEYTVIGDAVNCAARLCDGARGGEVLISPQVYQWVWKIVEATSVNVKAKHEGALPGFRVKGVKRYESDEFVRRGTE